MFKIKEILFINITIWPVTWRMMKNASDDLKVSKVSGSDGGCRYKTDRGSVFINEAAGVSLHMWEEQQLCVVYRGLIMVWHRHGNSSSCLLWRQTHTHTHAHTHTQSVHTEWMQTTCSSNYCKRVLMFCSLIKATFLLHSCKFDQFPAVNCWFTAKTPTVSKTSLSFWLLRSWLSFKNVPDCVDESSLQLAARREQNFSIYFIQSRSVLM